MYFIEFIACLHQFLTIFMKFIEVIILDLGARGQTSKSALLHSFGYQLLRFWTFPFSIATQSFSDPFSWTENFTQLFLNTIIFTRYLAPLQLFGAPLSSASRAFAPSCSPSLRHCIGVKFKLRRYIDL